MTKTQYLDTLHEYLRQYSSELKSEIVEDITNHFTEGVAAGKSEEEIINRLGSPEMVVKEFDFGQQVKQAETNPRTKNVWRVVYATIGLSLLNIIFVLAPFLTVWVLFITLWLCGIIFIVAGFGGWILTFIGYVNPSFIEIGVHPILALLTFGTIFFLGITWTILTQVGIKLFYKLTIRYIRFNLKFITYEN